MGEGEEGADLRGGEGRAEGRLADPKKEGQEQEADSSLQPLEKDQPFSEPKMTMRE